MRILAIAAIYTLALALIWAGSLTAPQIGWPRTDTEMHGSALLILGLVVKTIGHWQMMLVPHRV